MPESLTKQMRVATREVHKLSDALVNAKLAFALNDNDVWCDGILVFYEIFKFLERNVSDKILPTEYHRREQFEKDLEFYLGEDWMKSYKIRESVQLYLDELNAINDRNPLLLIAYVYHLYMGLLSGGQILSKKRSIANKWNGKTQTDDDENSIQPGNHLTSFDKSIFELKAAFKKNIDDFTKDFDDELRCELIEESRRVFELNNTVIASVVGINAQLRKNLMSVLSYCVAGVLCVYVFYILINFLF